MLGRHIQIVIKNIVLVHCLNFVTFLNIYELYPNPQKTKTYLFKREELGTNVAAHAHEKGDQSVDQSKDFVNENLVAVSMSLASNCY